MPSATVTASVLRTRVPRIGRMVRCYTCQGSRFADTSLPHPIGDRERWPRLPCTFTPGCPGLIEPEALN